MKRILSLILLVTLMAGCVTGCGEEEYSETETYRLNRASYVDYGGKYRTVGFIQTGKESDWRDANTQDFLRTFTKDNGYIFLYVDGNSDPERQRKAMYDLVAQNVDYIILDPIVESDWEEPLMAAQEKNIPVIISDRKVDADPSLYTCWIGSDFKKEGRKAAEWLESWLIKKNREEEDLYIILLEGTKDATAAIGRTEGLYEVINKHKNWHVVARPNGDFTQGQATTVMEQALQRIKDFDVVIAENDNMMFGAMKAMDEAGITYGSKGDVITISFDALGEAFDLMKKNKLMLSVECNPLLAGLCEKTIRDLRDRKEVEPVQYIDEGVFSYENYYRYIDTRMY